ncbi:MAG: hypothetical protein ACK42C_08415 [Aquificaceae bacterium]|jgi:hypothetical protein|uniref:hypothetical protein n=1 Tax=Hydrogenobacter sp. Uz 6-8 TaxID=3384828 RepID=UPI0030A10E7D
MEKVYTYRKRSRHLHYAFVFSLVVLYFACLPLYPYFRVPLHENLVSFFTIFVLAVGLISLPPALLLRKRLFPVETLQDPYWSYTATRRYFWLYVLCLVPFAFALLVFIAFASLVVLSVGFLVSLCGLILVRPKEEDLK